MRLYHCWRCDQTLPFLNEDEWVEIEPLLKLSFQKIKDYRAKHGVDLETAYQETRNPASDKFEELTGMTGFYVDAIYHHRLALCGSECLHCGHLLRSPQATYCVNCGEKK